MEQMAEKQSGKGDRGTMYAGILTAGGVVAYVMQCAEIPPLYKLAFVALVSVSAFAGFIVRYFLQVFDWHIKRHDALSTLAHVELGKSLTEQCTTSVQIRDELRIMNERSRGQ